jgi:hypothetical protein
MRARSVRGRAAVYRGGGVGQGHNVTDVCVEDRVLEHYDTSDVVQAVLF